MHIYIICKYVILYIYILLHYFCHLGENSKWYHKGEILKNHFYDLLYRSGHSAEFTSQGICIS